MWWGNDDWSSWDNWSGSGQDSSKSNGSQAGGNASAAAKPAAGGLLGKPVGVGLKSGGGQDSKPNAAAAASGQGGGLLGKPVGVKPGGGGGVISLKPVSTQSASPATSSSAPARPNPQQQAQQPKANAQAQQQAKPQQQQALPGGLFKAPTQSGLKPGGMVGMGNAAGGGGKAAGKAGGGLHQGGQGGGASGSAAARSAVTGTVGGVNSSSAKDLGDDLPLRLQAEPVVKDALGPASRVIGSDGRPVLIFTDAGLVAIAVERQMQPHELSQAVGIPPRDLPKLTLVRGFGPGLTWLYEGSPIRQQPKQQFRDMALNVAIKITEPIAEVAVRTIQRYYKVQVLEPSTRGFLSILEKQFARSDLYLFEILQNAVDDGALFVSFDPNPKGLAVKHNGRRFNALDVLGLSSVGLSTKGDGQKRTIGFMGIGFKAVYKRFARVLIHDGMWRFAFEEPQGAASQSDVSKHFGWVLQPNWETPTNLWDQSHITSDWCHFQLERAREGAAGVQRDLAKLPDGVPALLGRQALKNAARRGVERVMKEAAATNPADWMRKIGQDALMYWWMEAQTAFGILTADLAASFFAQMLTQLKQGQPKEQIWASSRPQLAKALETNMESQDRVADFGWRYIDDNRNVQGPFRASQMRGWYQAGKLKPTLPVSGVGMGDYRPLKEVFGQQESEVPFASPGLPPARFQLEWNATEHIIALSGRSAMKDNGTSEEVTVWLVPRSGRAGASSAVQTRRWLFVSIIHSPDQEARAAYEKHAKREFIGDEEISMFLPLDSDKCPLPLGEGDGEGGRGSVHAVLPTEMKIPIGAHLQASWLLSVDRQKVQDFADNAWNRALLVQLPKLLVNYFRWVAGAKLLKIETAYTLLPPFDMSQGMPKSNVLGQDLNWAPLKAALSSEQLVPVFKDDGSVGYEKAQDAIWVPPSFATMLPASLLREWLGAKPLAVTKLGKAAYHPLWLTVKQVDTNLLNKRRKELAAAVAKQKNPIATAVKLLGALAMWIDQSIPTLAGGAGQANKNIGARPVGAIGGVVKKTGTVGLDAVAKGDALAQKAVWMDKLPDFVNWPVFKTSKGEFVMASQIQWPDPGWGKLPQSVRDILESGATPSANKQQTLHGDLVPLINAGDAIQAGKVAPAANQPVPETLKIEGCEPFEISAARKAMGMARLLVPTAAVGVGDGVQKRMKEWAVLGKAKGLEKSIVDKVVAISQWAMENNDAAVISHALSGTEKALQLLPVGDLFLRTQAIVDLEALSGVRLPNVSSIYFDSKPHEAPRWEAFWQKGGARSGLAFVASKGELAGADKQWLPGARPPPNRNSRKEDTLPFNLGPIRHTEHKVVEVSFARQWGEVLDKLSSKAPEGDDWPQRAAAFATLLSKLVPDVSGGVAPVQGSEVAMLSGKTSGPGAAVAIPQNLPATHKPLQPNVQPPGCRRVFYMPAGKPGTDSMVLGPAHWLRQLADAKWVPGREASGDNGQVVKRGWYRASEVLLAPDPSKPGFPLAELPADIRKVLQGKAFLGLLKWGTKTPAPPVDRLVTYAAALSKGLPAPEPLEPLWRGIAQARKMGGLTKEFEKKLKDLSKQKIFPAPPGGLLDGEEVVTAERCIAVKTDAAEELKAEGRALAAARWLVDLRDPSYPLSDCAEDMAAVISDIPTSVGLKAAQGFLGHCCEKMPDLLTADMKAAFTHSVTKVMEAAKSLPMQRDAAMKQKMPDLKIFLKDGPGLGKDRFPARWISAFEFTEVTPVLNDSAAKAAMLTPAQGMQMLGVLDHAASKSDKQKLLADRDNVLLDTLKIKRLSDKDFNLETKVEGERKMLMDVTERLQVIMKLLWLAAGRGKKEGDEDMSEEAAADAKPPGLHLYKCGSISRQLMVAGGGKPAAGSEAFAVWGDDEDDGVLSVLVAGEPDDYIAELEELLALRFTDIFSALATRPAKVLNLLRHIESESRFTKFVERDFAGLLEHDEEEKKKARERAARAKAEAEQRAAKLAKSTEEAVKRKLAQDKEEMEQWAKQNAEEDARRAKEREEQERLEQAEAEAAMTAIAAAEEAKAAELAALKAKLEEQEEDDAEEPDAKRLKTGDGDEEDDLDAELAALKAENSALSNPSGVKRKLEEEANSLEAELAALRAEKENLLSGKKAKIESAATTDSKEKGDDVAELEAELAKLRAENQRLKPAGDAESLDMEAELARLRDENCKLRCTQPEFLYGCGEMAEEDKLGAAPLDKENEESEEEREIREATKGEIKRMKKDAEAVLKRPIAEGFGFKMLQKMGWKEGEGLGMQKDGLATPLWVEPREGKAGLFSTKDGESRPVKDTRDEDERLADVRAFVQEGFVKETEGKSSSSASSSRPRQPRPRPTASNVAPAVMEMLLRPSVRGILAEDVGGPAGVGALLGEVLQGEVGEQFLRLVDERLGQRVAPRLAEIRRRRRAVGSRHARDQLLEPLWQLTRHHAGATAEEDDEF
eukprot:TRINITY_DN29073_c0_g1_i1.p1 TRINITY_DN29073_c0_g1~~TRINITY_DN29073_c0_g1_i1.p1  ORF type:complete len:2453 (+),score=733.32 TRINITY_DN29073_c0_g1_i1:150-7508(+)